MDEPNVISQVLPNQMSQGTTKPLMVFTYSQKYEVEGYGTYEVKVTNLVNPNTLRSTPTTPSLINPIYMIAAQNQKNKPLAIQNTKISEGAKLRMLN